MLYILAIAAAITAGVIAGGKVSNLADIRINKAWLIIVAFSMQALVQILGMREIVPVSQYSIVISGVVYCLLFACFWFNRNYIGIWFIAAGSFMNALVMMANGGKMPVEESILESQGAPLEIIEKVRLGMDGKHSIIDGSTKLVFLSDIIETPPFLDWMMQIVSIGDLVVVLGLFILVFEIVKKGNTLNNIGGSKSAVN
ncbi:MAG TPA: DUF5317 domain-containing protein [Clostridiaceae bacterium]|jgi:hypothetical protein|nr:DUF5317 domain-containing protein [Clostridiaceae bacterium]